jgi:regulator of protease activity HflC (stomatin/prohibitin superfamily)
MDSATTLCISAMIVASIITVMLYALASVRRINPWERGIKMVGGKCVAILDPGIYFIPAGIAKVVRVDMRTQTIRVPKQRCLTRDGVPVVVDAVVYARVADPKKAVMEVPDWKLVVKNFVLVMLRALIGERSLADALRRGSFIDEKLKEITCSTSREEWGVEITNIKVNEVVPAPPEEGKTVAQIVIGAKGGV